MNARNRTMIIIAGVIAVLIVLAIVVVAGNPGLARSLGLTSGGLSGTGGTKPTATPGAAGGGSSCTASKATSYKIACGTSQTSTTVSTPNSSGDLSYCNFATLDVSTWDFGGSTGSVNMTGTKFQGSNVCGANFTNANLTNAAFSSATNGTAATVTGATWNNTTCPDGTNSNNNGNTCVGHGF
ncbi:MAG: pentapeptide repeat-containing protein [Anaerolineae bacterium]